jgi:AcrR family transcriptional regulator
VPTSQPRPSGSDPMDVAERILDAARTLVLRNGARRLSLTDVATMAGVSRPTVYRYFLSKEELIDALGKNEYRRFNTAMDEAVAGTVGLDRLDAAIDVVVAFLKEQPPRGLVDLEPGFTQDQMAQVLPMMTRALAAVLADCVRDEDVLLVAPASDVAGAIARTALSHYIFPDPDDAAALRQIRAAAGLPVKKAARRPPNLLAATDPKSFGSLG